jgi:uncharacterized protein
MALEVQTTLLEDPEFYEMVRQIADAYHPLRIYLFGSKARGDAGPDSDYDLLVVVIDDAPPELRKSKLAYEKLWGGVGASGRAGVHRRLVSFAGQGDHLAAGDGFARR